MHTGSQCWRQETKYLPQRKIPGHNGQHYAKWLKLTRIISSKYDASASGCIYQYLSTKDVSGYPDCGAGQKPVE